MRKRRPTLSRPIRSPNARANESTKGSGEGLFEVRDEVGHVLDAGRVADESLRYARGASLLVGAFDVARHHRGSDHRLDAPQVGGAVRELEPRPEARDRFQPAAHREAQPAAEA